MTANSLDLLWRIVSAEICSPPPTDAPVSIEDLYSTGMEWPADVEGLLVDYIASRGRREFMALAVALARRFVFVQQNPAAHLLLVGYLLANGQLSVREAVPLAHFSASQYPASQKDVFELTLLAERVEEEERIGFMSADEDRFFENALAEFCRKRGFAFFSS